MIPLDGFTAAIAILALFFVVLVTAFVFSQRYIKVGPNEVLVISGRKRRLVDPVTHEVVQRNFRLLKGGGTFIVRHDDTDPGARYGIGRGELDARVNVTIPELHWLKLYASHRQDARQGHRQSPSIRPSLADGGGRTRPGRHDWIAIGMADESAATV